MWAERRKAGGSCINHYYTHSRMNDIIIMIYHRKLKNSHHGEYGVTLVFHMALNDKYICGLKGGKQGGPL